MKSTITYLAILTVSCMMLGNGNVAYGALRTYMQGLNDYQGTHDTRLIENTLGSQDDINFNNSGSMLVTRAHTNNPTESAALLRFDDLGIPAGATINSVTLRVSKIANFAYVDTGFDAPGVQMDVAGLLVDFGAEGIGNVDSSGSDFTGVDGGPTANNRRRPDVQNQGTYIAWNTPLARSIGPDYTSASYDSTFDRGPVDSSISGIMNADGGYLDFDVTTSFTSQFANNKMYGWVVHGDVAPQVETDGQLMLRDSEFADADPLVITKPQLVVDFTPIGGDLDGDFDNDGDVDGNDFLVWQHADATSAGLLDWQGNFPSTASSVGVATAIPEPASLALFAMGILGFLSSFRSSREHLAHGHLAQ